jgi:hypothetical protein
MRSASRAFIPPWSPAIETGRDRLLSDQPARDADPEP